MSGWTLLWLLWGGAFLLIEGVALLNRSIDDTLSEHFWRWLAVGDRMPTWLVWTLRAGVLLFCLWLGFHLSFGWFTPTHPWPF